MGRCSVLLWILVGCTAYPAVEPELSLADRFELVALYKGDHPKDELWKWEWPIRVKVTGSQQYYQDVIDHLALLGDLTGLPTEMDSARPTMIVDFSIREQRSWCRVSVGGNYGLLRADISIRTDQSEAEIRRCIVQEMTQALGLLNDLDGRTDTNFTSYGRVIELTKTDRQLLAILYDERLYDGMPRADVLAVLPAIVAEVEAKMEQEAERQ